LKLPSLNKHRFFVEEIASLHWVLPLLLHQLAVPSFFICPVFMNLCMNFLFHFPFLSVIEPVSPPFFFYSSGFLPGVSCSAGSFPTAVRFFCLSSSLGLCFSLLMSVYDGLSFCPHTPDRYPFHSAFLPPSPSLFFPPSLFSFLVSTFLVSFFSGLDDRLLLSWYQIVFLPWYHYSDLPSCSFNPAHIAQSFLLIFFCSLYSPLWVATASIFSLRRLFMFPNTFT